MDRYTIIIAVISLSALLQRLLREDVKWAPTIKAPFRGLVVALLSLVLDATLNSVLVGDPWPTALIGGLLAALPTIMNVIGSLTRAPSPAKLAGIVGGAIMLTMSACSAGNVVCPIIHAADELCPFIIVELTDGGVERVPRATIQQLAVQRRAARLLGDGGAR